MRLTYKHKTLVLSGMQTAIGVVTVVRAAEIASAPWLGLSSRFMVQVVRVLGTREVLQGLGLALFDAPTTVLAGAVVDGAHALSMLPVAARRGPYRRPAAISAALAGVVAVAEFTTSRAAAAAV